MVECPSVTPTPFFEDDEHHENMDELKFPTGLVGEGEQFAEIVESSAPIFTHDNHLANMDLQAQENHVGQEQQPEEE